MVQDVVAVIRPFVIDDYQSAIRFWSMIDGMGLNESDTLESIDAFLIRNPEFSAVAVVDGSIVGTILCGHNGRAGSLHHLAVAPSHRGLGIGVRLVEYCFAKLGDANIPRCNIFVYSDNEQGNRFWLRNGWIDPPTWKVLQKHVLKSA